MKTDILSYIYEKKQKGLKSFAVLIDPDKFDAKSFEKQIKQNDFEHVSFIFVGGSLITGGNLHETLKTIKQLSNIPTIIFPGSNLHIDSQADAILFLSLISGRNPDHLIGQHVAAAPILKRSNLQVLPTGYILIEGGKTTTVSYISNTTPIPADKPEIAVATAMAGEMLGLKLIYTDSGSGAKQAINNKMLSMLKQAVDVPIIVGGGIRTAIKAKETLEAGADIVVIGNAFEENPSLIKKIGSTIASI